MYINNKQKQDIIEKYFDDNIKIKEMGIEMNALLSLEARKSRSLYKATPFIIDFSKSLGFNNHLDTACRIIHYVYPINRKYWKIWDKLYLEQVNNSFWLNNQL